MDKLLKPCNDSSAYLYRSSDLKRFTCDNVKELSQFLAKSLLESNINHDLFVDWTRCITHPIIFDIHIENPDQINTYDLLMDYFNLKFLTVLKNYLSLPKVTMVISMPRDRCGGMRVHLPNVELSHDDYQHLCFLMKSKCDSKVNNIKIYLNNPSFMCLISTKFNNSCKLSEIYVPVRLIEVEFEHIRKNFNVNFIDIHYKKDNMTLFEQVLNYISRDKKIILAMFMMPISQKFNHVIYLKFPTRIFTNTRNTYMDTFTSCINNQEYVIVKERKLCPSKEGESFCYQFLKQNSPFIENVSFSQTLQTWYKRFKVLKNKKDIGRIYYSIDEKIRKMCVHLKEDESPLYTLLNSNLFCKPTFFSLCNILSEKNFECNEIYKLLPENSPLRLSHEIPEESFYLNFDTLLYCAFKSNPLKTKEGIFLGNIEKAWDWILEGTTTISEMKQHVYDIQKKFFPIVKGPEEKIYYWNPFQETWLPVEEKANGIEGVIEYVYKTIQEFRSFKKISLELSTMLNNDEKWIQSICVKILNQLQKQRPIEGNLEQISYNNLFKKFGENVPEYYFFNYKIDPYDTC